MTPAPSGCLVGEDIWHVLLGGDPGVDGGHAEEITSLSWLGNASGNFPYYILCFETSNCNIVRTDS